MVESAYGKKRAIEYHPEPSADENTLYIIRSDAANLASLISFANFAAEETKQGCGLHQRYLHDDPWGF